MFPRQSMERGALGVATLCLVAGLSACGGSQQPAAPVGAVAPDAPVAAPVERAPELTAEEREAERQEQIARHFAAAADAYRSGREGTRDYARIEESLRAVLALNNALPDVWFNLGQIYFEQGRTDDARQAWERAGEVDERYARGMAALSAFQLAEGDLAAARETLERCIERRSLEPGCNVNLSLLARLDAMEGRDTIDPRGAQDAIDRLRFALAGDGRNANAYAALARIYFDLGRFQLARLVCETAIQLGIDDAILHNRLGLIALEEDDVITAYREFQRAVELDPTYRDAHLNIGAMALSFRDYEAARAAFAAVLSREPGNLDARLSHGVALRGLERFDEAEAEYRVVLDAQDTHLGAMLNMGLLNQEFLQDYPEAVRWYQAFLEAGGAQGERGPEVRQRIEVLEELIELLGADA